MTEYRIVEAYRKIWIEKQLNGDLWVKVDIKDVPKYHATVADARSWVATLKRGVVYHDAEDAPNLAQDERKAEYDTSDGIKPVEWFFERVRKTVKCNYQNEMVFFVNIYSEDYAIRCFVKQNTLGCRYYDPR